MKYFTESDDAGGSYGVKLSTKKNLRHPKGLTAFPFIKYKERLSGFFFNVLQVNIEHTVTTRMVF